jgi:protein O-mannosyl-transferase
MTNPSNNILIPALLIVFSAMAVYFSSLSHDLVYCDDNLFVINYHEVHSKPKSLINSFTETIGTSYYRPILSISLIIDTLRGGTDPEVFHQTNLVLHITASLLLILFLLKLGYKRIEVTIFTLIFTLHPILVPAVSWISGRNDSLLAVSFLAAMILFLQSRESKSKLLFSILTGFFFLIALLTKELAVLFPIAALALEKAFYKDSKLIDKEKYINYSIWGGVLILWFLLRMNALDGVANSDQIGLMPFLENIPALPSLFGKFFLPIKMFVLSSFELFSVATGMIFLGVIVYFVLKNRSEGNNKALFGLFWFALLLLPTLFVRIANVDDFFDYAEHRIYLPMVGILITLIEILRQRGIDYSKKSIQIIFLCLIVALGIRSYQYSLDFKNRSVFWNKMIETFPKKSRGYLDLGKSYMREGDFAQAEKLYHHGISINPNNKNLYIDLSILYMQTKNYAQAQRAASKALELDSLDPIANFNFGKTFQFAGDIAKAIPYFERAVARTAKYPEWFLDLGSAYFAVNDLENAKYAFNAALRLQPRNAIAWSNLAAVYATNSDYQKAEHAWTKAIQINPKYYEAYNNLIKLYLNSHDYDKAQIYKEKLQKNGGGISAEIEEIFKK